MDREGGKRPPGLAVIVAPGKTRVKWPIRGDHPGLSLMNNRACIVDYVYRKYNSVRQIDLVHHRAGSEVDGGERRQRGLGRWLTWGGRTSSSSGTPKGGTTALHSALVAHPQLQLSRL